MAVATTKNMTENDFPEVFVRTPEAIAGKTCDSCGEAVSAKYDVSKGEQHLYFCGHHVRRFADKLIEQGFAIYPERYDLDYTGAPEVAKETVSA